MLKNGPWHNSFFPYKWLILQLKSFKHSKMGIRRLLRKIVLKGEKGQLKESTVNRVRK